MKKRKPRLISSISDIITNSSTQVFFLDIDDTLNEMKGKLESDCAVFINSKEDFLNKLEDYEKSGTINDNGIFHFLSYIFENELEAYGIASYGAPGSSWITLNKEGGKTYREIGEFIWPIIKDYIEPSGKVYYSYEDNCYYNDYIDELYKKGYSSDRV